MLLDKEPLLDGTNNQTVVTDLHDILTTVF